MHESFLHAINPSPRHSCLRLPLRPLTLGHRFLLLELESPLLLGDPCGFGDILLAVLVCAQSHARARRMLRRNRWLSFFAWYWGIRCRRCVLKDEIAKFSAYLKDEQAAPPKADPPSGQGRSLGAPLDWLLYDFLLRYGNGEEWVLNLPIRTANALWHAHYDFEGRIQLSTATGSVASVIKEIWRRRRESAALQSNGGRN